jgi:hypothetical protein
MTNRNRGAGGDGVVFRSSQGYGELYADTAGEVLERANEVRRAYYEAVAANEAAALQDRLLEAAKATAELANEQYRSGTLSRLDQSRRQLAYVEAHKEQVQARQAATAAREALNGTLRLPPEARGWPLPERLPDLPAARPEIADVVDLALRNRPDAIAAGVTGPASPLGARIAAEAARPTPRCSPPTTPRASSARPCCRRPRRTWRRCSSTTTRCSRTSTS